MICFFATSIDKKIVPFPFGVSKILINIWKNKGKNHGNRSGGEQEHIWWFPLYCCLTLPTASSPVTVPVGADCE